MELAELAEVIDPTRTTLLFGAGASIPSGAPSARQLTQRLAKLLQTEPDGDELSEIAQLVENRKGRKALVEAIRQATEGLTPTAGLLALPQFDWLSIYTTNYDTLVEQSYRKAERDLVTYRSNFDLAQPRTDATPLYKIHGCISQDSADGHKTRMLITESDYDEYEKYRQTLFNSLAQHMFTSDTVIIGQSLRDRHLKELAKKVTSLRTQGVASRVFLLVHQYDPDRTELYSRLGIDVVHANLDDLLLLLLKAGKTVATPSYSTSTEHALLTPELVLQTIDVAHSKSLNASATRLFNGSPATYADISQGLTISRVAQRRLKEAMSGTRGFFQVIEGARGVGKTTLARAFVLELSRSNVHAWEHRPDSPLDADAWMGVDARLRRSRKDAILFVDDASRHLPAVNALVDRLSATDRPHLRVIITVDSAKWKAARKSRGFFSRGTLTRVSILERADLEDLVALLDRRPEIKSLVEDSFLALGRPERLARLRNKCSSEMFVCLKNIFANDNLDDILLQEYFSLDPETRDVYRYVSAIQALEGHVHRQLIVRLLNINAATLDSVLTRLEGIVMERVIDSRQGIYGWATRHDVIATVIARLKFADTVELEQLFIELIDGLNPTVPIELETAIALATRDYGITRLPDLNKRVSLYRRLIDVIPSQRTPRRRLVKLFLSNDMLPEANHELAAAERAFGPDMVLTRYKALVSLRKAETMQFVEDSDRLAWIRDAETIMRRCIRDYRPDMHNYRALGQIGLALASRQGGYAAIDDALHLLGDLEASVGDPHIRSIQRQLSESLRRMESQQVGEVTDVESVLELDPEEQVG